MLPGQPSSLILDADILTAVSMVLGTQTSRELLGMTDLRVPITRRKFFSQTIMDTTSELPVAVIKELQGGFKNYIPLALCTHKACLHATRSTDAYDTENGMNKKEEIRLKQKTLTAADHYLTMDDFTEIRENIIWGMRKYLVLGGDTEPGGVIAMECAEMFAEFFSNITARPDFTADWSSYRGYIIETYSLWVGQRDNSYGLIFDEGLFHKYKMKNLISSILEQIKQHVGGGSTHTAAAYGTHRGNSSFSSQ